MLFAQSLLVSTLGWSVLEAPVNVGRRVAGCRTGAPQCVLTGSAAYLEDIPQGAPDAILGIAQAFRESDMPNKVNLAVGAYRDDGGVPFVLPSVREAEKRLLARGEKKEYLPIDGLPSFKDRALGFAYGEDCAALKEGRVAGVQTLSGTGACRIAGEFYARFLPEGTAVYVSDPTWGNHIPIMELAGLEVRRYRYLNRATNGLDYEGYLADIEAAPAGSVFLLHACAHNPTGVDPTPDQWRQISRTILDKGHHVLLDCAYQGFASGDAEADAFAIRLFLDEGHSLLLAQSFAKNFGLYGERVGTLSVAYIHTYIHACHACPHARMHACTHACTHAFVHRWGLSLSRAQTRARPHACSRSSSSSYATCAPLRICMRACVHACNTRVRAMHVGMHVRVHKRMDMHVDMHVQVRPMYSSPPLHGAYAYT